MKILIKPVKTGELKRVLFITKLAYKNPYKAGTLINKAHEAKNVAELFTKKEFFVIAAVVNKKIIGAVRYKFIKNNNLYFYKLAVLKSYRNKGVGSLLINELGKIAGRKKIKKISLDCAQEKKLPDYYKNLGFRIDKIEKHLDHHDVYMSKSVKNNKKRGFDLFTPFGATEKALLADYLGYSQYWRAQFIVQGLE